MGVRISWLMLARNSLLARLAASAASLALWSSSSICFRSVMSMNATTAPTTFPSFHCGWDQYSAGKLVTVFSPEYLVVGMSVFLFPKCLEDAALVRRIGIPVRDGNDESGCACSFRAVLWGARIRAGEDRLDCRRCSNRRISTP